ncbi:hypothetical protein [Streptomyces chromofuscus]|uniref:Uncharacterized protein n=1 Tax=Streptomyces chromofuscus TaxID=42881 RepID=A0A7M2T737_STRCW|nr:hypothetical protein [Streptomyces chromofuscus]QOV44520.1 hypothetical protein IPT68_00185 [Streptomyces chromofuscus]GGT42745.1 hypothetical protein GCM10010254_72880 [Streptomyces chromofuscus]
MQTQPHRPISGIVDAVVTTSLDADGALAFHLVVGPSNRPHECDRIEFTLDLEDARALVGDAERAVTAQVPCRLGVEFNAAPSARHP